MVRFLLLLLSTGLMATMGCVPTTGGGGGNGGTGDPAIDDPDGDLDGDLLSNSFEATIGSDPENADTDGDGFEDGLEYVAFFKPWAEDDFPYTGGYARGPTPPGSRWDEITADDGWDEGDVSGSWTTEDRFGETIRLKRFFGQVVMLDFSAEWCPPCRQAAETLEEEWEDRVDNGFTVIQLMLDGYGQGDGQPDLDRWASDFDLHGVAIVDDGGRDLSPHYFPAQGGGIPMFAQINRDFEVAQWGRAGTPAPFTETDQFLLEEWSYADEVDEWWPLPDNVDEIRSDLGFGDSEWRGYADAIE